MLIYLKCEFIHSLTCSLPLLVSSSWVDISLINSCEDEEFSIVRRFLLYLYKERSLQMGSAPFPLYFPDTAFMDLPKDHPVCHSIQQSAFYYVPIPLFRSWIIAPGVCMQKQSPETSMLFSCGHCPCFDSGCMLVARDECRRRRKMCIRQSCVWMRICHCVSCM